MKRILASAALFGAAVVLLATPGANHKIDWCHFPPGQWTGNPSTSKVNILSIDVAADGTPQGGQHLNHTGDGPAGGVNNLGQPLTADCKLGGSCPGSPFQ